jgi:UDP-GlcNAc:undecaprenyl-phosphate/decaprenyl-phosphate GlcNAc-1-phosphate transferase
MGDAGSTLMGFALAGLSLVAVQPASPDLPPVLILWLLAIPTMELFSSTLRRLARGVSPLQADREHFHDRLLQAGFSGRVIFAIYAASSAVFAIAGLSFWRLGLGETALFYLFVLLAGLWWVTVLNARRLRLGWLRHVSRGARTRREPSIVCETDPGL